MTDEQIVKDSFVEYTRSLLDLKIALHQLTNQTRKTNKVVAQLLGSTHVNSLLSMTGQFEFMELIKSTQKYG